MIDLLLENEKSNFSLEKCLCWHNTDAKRTLWIWNVHFYYYLYRISFGFLFECVDVDFVRWERCAPFISRNSHIYDTLCKSKVVHVPTANNVILIIGLWLFFFFWFVLFSVSATSINFFSLYHSMFVDIFIGTWTTFFLLLFSFNVFLFLSLCLSRHIQYDFRERRAGLKCRSIRFHHIDLRSVVFI